tara:strand:+ start:1605 stop:2087 length:483 start_codon:yes stop_codon:yes gene_type:complete
MATSLLGIISIAGQGIGTLLSLRSQRQALAYQQMQSRMQVQQYQDAAVAVELETIQAQIDRRERYTTQLAENRALMAQTGIALDSPSYRAFLKANEKTYRKDINRLRTQGTERQVSALREAEQSRLTGRAAGVTARTEGMGTIGRSLLRASDTAREFDLL